VAAGEEVSLVNGMQSAHRKKTHCYVWFDGSDLNCLEHSSCGNVPGHLRYRFVLDVTNAIPDLFCALRSGGDLVFGNLRSAIMIEDVLE
jgi:hypothetical protein